MKVRKKENEFLLRKLLFYILIYKFSIEIVYIFLISPVYSYMNLELNMNISKFLLSSIYVFIIVFNSPKNKITPSTYFFLTMEFFIIIPTLSYYWLNDMSSTYTFFLAISSLVVTLVLKVKLKPFTIKNRAAIITLKGIFVLYVLSTVYIILSRGGVDLRALNFDSVYELRSEYNLIGFMGYLANWSAKVFCPFYLGYFYLQKNYKGVVFVSILQVLMYLSFGNKAFLFSLGIIFLNLLYVKRGKYIKEMSLTMSGLNLLALVLSSFNITDTLQRAVPYRLVFIPAQIQYYYYEFFADNRKLLFADNIFGRIFSIENPFGKNISFIIGDLFYRTGAGINANTGIFADAYANGGFFLMIFISIVFGILLAIVDASTTRIPIYMVVGALSYIMFVINDAPLLTTLITGGMFIMIIMLIILNSSLNFDKRNLKFENISVNENLI